MAKHRIQLLIYSIGHFIVDFACAFLIYHLVYGTEHWYQNLIFYNFCAFALQMPLGLIADKWNRNGVCAALGCMAVAISFGLGAIGPTAMVIVAGIGNGLFHIGGGVDVMNISNRKASLLGVFVAPGALGIYCGTLIAKQNKVATWTVLLLLFIITVAILLSSYRKCKSLHSENEPLSFHGISTATVLLAIGCLFVVVSLRSYIGMVSNFEWKSKTEWGITFIFAVFLGKLLGGFLADKFGVVNSTVISLGVASFLYLFSNVPLAGIIAVFLFNMTMPVTLWALGRILQGAKGFAFGLLTFALFLGFLPVYLGEEPLITSSFGFALSAIGSMVLLILGLHKVVNSWEVG